MFESVLEKIEWAYLMRKRPLSPVSLVGNHPFWLLTISWSQTPNSPFLLLKKVIAFLKFESFCIWCNMSVDSKKLRTVFGPILCPKDFFLDPKRDFHLKFHYGNLNELVRCKNVCWFPKMQASLYLNHPLWTFWPFL